MDDFPVIVKKKPTNTPLAVVVIGLGYIGLPTAAILAQHGAEVVGVDINHALVDSLNQHAFYSPEPGLLEAVQDAVRSGRLRAQTTVPSANVFIIAVPTPITEDKQADLSYVAASVDSLLPVLKPGNLIIIESTIPPGTSRHTVEAYLRRNGHDQVLVAHCPERVLPGQLLRELLHNHRIVGGTSPQATEAACEVYRLFAKGPVQPTTAETAEMVKVMENTYRDVNIALANELAQLAEEIGISAHEVIRLANQHPRVNLHQPGPGVGGHCIAVDPWFLATAYPEKTPLIYTARRVNDSMPLLVTKRITQLVSTQSHPVITLLGATYKPNVTDTREAPSTQIYHLLQEQLPCADIRMFDPLVSGHPDLPLAPTLADALAGSDLLVYLVDHHAWKTLLNPIDAARLIRTCQLYDTQGKLDTVTWRQSGFAVYTLGEGTTAIASPVSS